jgi:AmmeMemoRadiSam system protein A
MGPSRSPEPPRLVPEHQDLLLGIARASIRHGLDHGRCLEPDLEALPAQLQADGASFVTLKLRGALRGCRGRLSACMPLAEDVAANAFSSAFQDWRFDPVCAGELAELHLHVSVLSELEPVAFADRRELFAQLEPGRHGLVLEQGDRRGTFLPDMWAELPDPREFLVQLLIKAGIGRLEGGVKAYRYTTFGFGCMARL